MEIENNLYNDKNFKCTTLGEYDVLKTLGAGGTCKVKLGRKTGTQDFVALKILKGKFALDDKATKAETEILRSLNHKNIINVLDM